MPTQPPTCPAARPHQAPSRSPHRGVGRRRSRIVGSVLLAVTALGLGDAMAAPSASAATAAPAAAARATPAARRAPVRRARRSPVRARRARRVVQRYPGAAAAPAAVAEAIRAAFPAAQWEKAFLVSWKESRWVPTASNGVCFGLFQMHRVHRARAAELGFTWAEATRDPRTNALMAADLWRRSGWRPWVTA